LRLVLLGQLCRRVDLKTKTKDKSKSTRNPIAVNNRPVGHHSICGMPDYFKAFNNTDRFYPQRVAELSLNDYWQTWHVEQTNRETVTWTGLQCRLSHSLTRLCRDVPTKNA